MVMSKPLHTNQDKKPLFVFAVLSSSLFSYLLFSTIGEGVFNYIYGAIGIVVVFFAASQLRQAKNKNKIKKKISHLVIYSICTIVSFFGTIGTGYYHIEKLKPNIKQVEIENDKKIINKVLSESKELNQWAAINLLNKKKKLNQKTLEIKQTTKKISSALSGISELLNVSERSVTLVFLIVFAALIEIMVFFTADFNGEIFKLPKMKKQAVVKKKVIKKNVGQLMLRKIG
jgi:hypothetical protein